MVTRHPSNPRIGALASHPLNDTGILTCLSPEAFVSCAQTPAQDGAQGRDAQAAAGKLVKQGAGAAGFDFTKLDALGQPLSNQHEAWQNGGNAATGTNWRCVRDNHTALIWEVKQDAPADISYSQFSYLWYSANAATNGGYAGEPASNLCAGVACDTASFVAAINQAQLCGLKDWRLPKVSELLSLVWGDRRSLAIDVDYFPNTPNSHFWTSQSFAPTNANAWYVYFSDGSPSNALKNTPMHIRLVHDAAGTNP